MRSEDAAASAEVGRGAGERGASGRFVAMRRRAVGLGICLVALAASSVAGGCESKSNAPPQEAAPADPGVAKEAKAENPGSAEKAELHARGGHHLEDFSAEDLERLELMGAEVSKHLAAAKVAVDAEDWATAVAEYGEALALDGDNPHIHGALGWAQFHTQAYGDASTNLLAALRFESERDRRARYLYRLGRVEEAQGDFRAAKRNYDHSLRLHDDAETRSHDEVVTTEVETKCQGGACEAPDFNTLKDACAAMVARVHRQLGLQPHIADQGFACDPNQAQRVQLRGGDAQQGALLELRGEHGLVAENEFDLLAKVDGGWHWVGTVLDVENPHKDGILRSGSIISFEARELIPDAPGLELLVRMEIKESDSDLDDNVAYHDEREAYLVCSVRKAAHECHEIPTRLLFEGEPLDVSKPTGRDVTRRSFKAEASFDGLGKVTLKGTGDLPAAFTGTHEIRALPEPEGFVFFHDD